MIFVPFLVQEMGFAQNQSEAAIQAYGTVQAALEALLAGKGKWPLSKIFFCYCAIDELFTG